MSSALCSPGSASASCASQVRLLRSSTSLTLTWLLRDGLRRRASRQGAGPIHFRVRGGCSCHCEPRDWSPASSAIARASPLTAGERRRLAAMGDQTATALERAHVAQALEESRVETEAERLRGTMLASLSHDLRTPIAGILGAASSLRTYGDRHDPSTRDGLLASIEDEATRMQRYVEKLLDMTRLDAGSIAAHLEPLDPSDVLAAVAARARKLDESRMVRSGHRA